MSTLYLYFGVSFIFSALTIKDFTIGSHHEASSVMLSIQLLGKQNVYANIGSLLGKGECFTFSYEAFHCNLSLILSRRHPCVHEGKNDSGFVSSSQYFYHFRLAWLMPVCLQCVIKDKNQDKSKANKQKKCATFLRFCIVSVISYFFSPQVSIL